MLLFSCVDRVPRQFLVTCCCDTPWMNVSLSLVRGFSCSGHWASLTTAEGGSLWRALPWVNCVRLIPPSPGLGDLHTGMGKQIVSSEGGRGHRGRAQDFLDRTGLLHI